MNKSFSIRALCLVLLLSALGTFNSNAAFKNWTNVLGGNWFDPFGWSPNGVPTANDVVTITNNGTYTVLVATGTVATAFINVGGGSGKQTFMWGSTAGFANLMLTNSTVLANGVLAITNQNVSGFLTIKSGGVLQFNAVKGIHLYNFGITNQGTISWLNGSLVFGSTVITNSGLFQATTDFGASYGGGGGKSVIYNSGTIRKASGTGLSYFSAVDIVNSGVVDVLTGTLQLNARSTNFVSGSYTATAPGLMKFIGLEADAGGTVSGSGQFQFTSGTFYLRTNTISNLKLIGGEVYVTGTTTFQQAGAITSLTLDGSNLHGTNFIAGTLTVNSGYLVDKITVEPTGQLLLPNVAGTQLYACNLINQGTVLWSGGPISVGNTSISNGGTWTMTGDAAMNYGGVGFATFTNAGTVLKTSGTGTSSVAGNTFVNLPSGLVSVSSGTLQMPFNYTNAAGELRLIGGTLTASGILGMTGGVLDGSGSIGIPAIFDGGTVSPGSVGTAGLIQFKSSLNLGTNATLALDGIGTIPGVQYDQLSVTGAVAISNCTLQISLPNVPAWTSFVIISNTTANATAGFFSGLPENSPLTISGQPFRIHYSGGSGNDVVLVRDTGSGGGSGALLSNTGYSNTVYRLTGVGAGSTIYTIQASTNLVQWTNIGFSTGDISGNFKFTDTNAYLFRYRMYRTTN